MILLSAWWLLLLPVGYLVIILHTLQPQRKRVIIPSTLLWQRLLRELSADARWRRIMANLLLLVQLAILGAIILSLAKPAFLFMPSLRHDVVLIDTSASMGATDIKPDRLTAIKEKLLAELTSRRPHRLTLIETGPQPHLIYDGVAFRRKISTVINQVQATHGNTNWPRVAKLLRSLSFSANTRVILATDAAFSAEDLQPLLAAAENLPLQLLNITTENYANAAIIRFNASQIGTSANECEVLVTLANYGSDSVQLPLLVTGAAGPVLQQTVNVPPGQQRNVLFSYTFATQEILEAHIQQTDYLPADDYAYLVAYPPEPTRVLLIGPGNYYLEQGLRIFPQVRLEKRLLYPGNNTNYALVIFDRMPVPADFCGKALYLAGTATKQAADLYTYPQITRWDRSHPLTRFIDWSAITISSTFPLPTDKGVRVLVDTETGPLLQLLSTQNAQLLQLGFRLEDSDWPRQVAFPVFLSHVLQWAHPEGWSYIRPAIQAGQPLPLPYVMSDEHGWLVQNPQGEKQKVPLVTGQYPTLRAGIYQVISNNNSYPIAVNAGDDSESNIRPRLLLPPPIKTDAKKATSPRQLWPFFVLLAFLLLLVEQWLYINRARKPLKYKLPWRKGV